MSLNRRLPALLFFALCATLFIAFLAVNAGAQDPVNLHINMKDGDILLPETKANPDSSPEVANIDAVYDEDPLGNKINRQWVDVGTWTAPDRETDFLWEDHIAFNIWYQIIDEGDDADPLFEFTLELDGTQYIYEVNGQDLGDSITELGMGDNLGEQRAIASDGLIELSIRYQGWEDCNLYYDNSSYDSGIMLHSDFLQGFSIEATTTQTTIEVFDSFGSDWEEVAHFVELRVEDEVVKPDSVSLEPGHDQEVHGSDVSSTLVLFEFSEPLEEDEELTARLKFTPREDGESKGMLMDAIIVDDGEKSKPVAEITNLKPNPVDEGVEVTMDGSGSSDEDGEVVRYVWKSSIDGELYNGSNDEFKTDELSPGNHEISLVVQDDDDLWSSEVTDNLRVEPNTPPTVELFLPDDGDYFTEGEVSLSWEGEDEDGDDILFDVYLDTDDDPEEIIEAGYEDESLDVSDLEDGTYYWKVVVSDGKTETESEVWSFEVELPKPNRPPTVTLEGPDNNTVVDHREPLTLEWEAEDLDGDAMQYTLMVEMIMDETTGETQTAAMSSGPYTSSFEIDELEPGQNYRWYVTVSDGKNETRSDYRFFISSGSAGGGGDDGDDDFEIAGQDGYMVIGAAGVVLVVLLVGAFFFIRSREDDEDDYYDDDDYYDEEEYYEDGYY